MRTAQDPYRVEVLYRKIMDASFTSWNRARQ